MANKKQSPVTVIILIAISVVAGFFIGRAVRPPRPPTILMAEYLVCMEENCPFRVSLVCMREDCLGRIPAEEVGFPPMCPECGAPVMTEGMELPPEMMPPPE